jgi:hypothetical protein
MRRAIAIAMLMLLPLSATQADVFRSVDAQGHVQYSDTPTPGSELIRINGQRLTVTPPPAPAPAPANQASAPAGDSIHQQLEKEAAERQVQNDVAQSRAQQCKKAQDNYNASIEAHRIYRTGPDGERILLSDDEVEKERLANKMAMDSVCGPQQ